MTMEKFNDPIKAILDPNNSEPIILYNDKDEPIMFDQIAVIPLDDKTYVILQPMKPLEDTTDDMAYAFEITKRNDEDFLDLVEDDDLIDQIFEEYKDLYKASRK